MTGWGRVRRARKQADRTYQVRLQALNDLLGEAVNHKYAENPLREGLRHSWKLRAITVTSEILGQIHPLVSEVRELWVSEEPDDWEELKEWEKDYWWRAEGILKATIISYTFMNIKVQDSTVANALDRDRPQTRSRIRAQVSPVVEACLTGSAVASPQRGSVILPGSRARCWS